MTYQIFGANRSSGTAIPSRFARARFKKMSDNLPDIREPITSPRPGEMKLRPIRLDEKLYCLVYKSGSMFSIANMPPKASPVAVAQIKTNGCRKSAYVV